jgi:hypothetical protein
MATKANLVIDQGTTYSVTINLTDENGDPLKLEGFRASSQLRKWYTSTNAVNFGCFINTADGSVTLELDSYQTSILSAQRYVYDVQLYDPAANTISRVLEGIATVTPQSTKQVL